MAKFYGPIGFADTVMTKPGVHEEITVERKYYGDLNRNTRGLQSSDQLNDNITIANEISIVADPYANDHFYAMRYVELNGVRWKISNITVNPPRLVLTVGGLYNG